MSARGRNCDSKKQRRRRNSRKQKAQQVTPSASQEAKFIEPCNQLLSQITRFDDSKPFHQPLPTKDALYNEYRKLNPDPICFKTVRKRLHQKPSSHYKSYEEFAKDVARIFVQEKKLKNYKGADKKAAEKRLTLAHRVENHWNALIAPYERYGFEQMMKSQQGSSESKDNEQETEDEQKNIVESEHKETPRRPPVSTTESKQAEQTRKTLSNIKKTDEPGEETPATTVNSKRRRLNNHDRVPGPNTGDTTASISHEDDAFHHASNSDEFSEIRDDEKVRHGEDEDDDDDVDLFQDNHNHNRRRVRNEDNTNYRNEYEKQNGHMFADTVFTPFADKSRVFNKNYNAQELFSRDRAVKKLLRFEGDSGSGDFEQHIGDKTPEKNNCRFEIKYTYTGDGKMMCTVTAPQMDMAVRQFRDTHKSCKILTAELLQ